MNIVRINEEINPEKYLIVTRQLNIDEVATTRILVSDSLNQTANIIEISRGVQGLQGPAGRNGVVFDILPIMSGGTNSSSFDSDKIIYYDGTKLTSSNYSLSDIITGGVLAGTGIVTVSHNGNITVNTNLGAGLYIEDNKIVVDFDLIDDRILQNIMLTAGSGLSFEESTSSYNVVGSKDIQVNLNGIELTPTGIAGTYTKITTDTKGRVSGGSNLTPNEIETLLGYIPWRSNNDGADSGLDADKLDSLHASFFRNAANLTGIIDKGLLPIGDPNTVITKIILDSNGSIESTANLSYSDIRDILNYDPVNSTGDILNGMFVINGSVFNSEGIRINDHLPILAGNHLNISYNDLRGFRFLYGNAPLSPKTGIFGYDYAADELKLIVDNETYVILNDKLADSQYAGLYNDNIFDGFNTFQKTTTFGIISVTGFNITSSSLINNLNCSFLENENKAYFKNAANLTGVLNSGNFSVVVSNISGTQKYVPIFDDRTTNPSRTIKDSIIYQKSGNLIEIQDGNLSIGNNNKINDDTTNGSILVGKNNSISGESTGFIFGESNIVNNEVYNGFIIGRSGLAKHNNAIILGQNGISWSENQVIYGLFESELKDAHGQYSVIGLNYNGTAPEYTNMEPANIEIPQNKTILYDLSVLINRFGTSGIASFKFENGIIKNLNVAIPDNPVVTENITVPIKEPQKTVLYNNSYIRDYFIAINASGLDSSIQNTKLRVDDPINFSDFMDIQNLAKTTIKKIVPRTLTATYDWQENEPGSFFGSRNIINLNFQKPLVSGYFVKTMGNTFMDIHTYEHNAILGSWIDIQLQNGDMVKERYKVIEVVDANTLKVEKERNYGTIKNYTYNSNNNTYDIVLSTFIKDSLYDISTQLHISYEIDNNYAVTETTNTFDLYKNESTIITGVSINGLNAEIFNTIYAPFPVGQISITPLINISGNCSVVPMIQVTGINSSYLFSLTSYFNEIDISDYKASKVFYRQYPSDTDGYSIVEISGIHNNQPTNNFPVEYTKWFENNYDQDLSSLSANKFSNNAAVHLSNNRSVYCEFAPYITTTYSGVTHNQVSGLSLNTAYRNLKGYSNINNNQFLLPGQDSNGNIIQISEHCQIFIDEINGTNISSYATTSGTIEDFFYISDSKIFVPYDYSNMNITGSIKIIDSGAYVTGYHPKNINILPTNIHPEHTHFSGYIKYQYPSESGSAVSGYADVYATPIYLDEGNWTLGEGLPPGRTLKDETISIAGNQHIYKTSIMATQNQLTFLYISKVLYYPTEYPQNLGPTIISVDADHGYRGFNTNTYFSLGENIPDKYTHIPVIFDQNIYFDNQIFDIYHINNNTIQLINHNLRNPSGDKTKYHRPNLTSVYSDPDYFNKSVSVGITGYLDAAKHIPFSGFMFNFASPCGDTNQVLDENYLIKIFRYNFPDVPRDEILYGYSLAKIYKKYYIEDIEQSLQNYGSGVAVSLSSDDLGALGGIFDMLVYEPITDSEGTVVTQPNNTGLLFWSHYATGNCNIPQNLINTTINIQNDNYGNKWGRSYDGNQLDAPLVLKYSASRYSPNCNSDQYCFEVYPISSFPGFLENDSVYVVFDTPYEKLNDQYNITKVDNFTKIFFTEKASVVESKINGVSDSFCGFVQLTKNHTQDSIMLLPPNSGSHFLTPQLTKFRLESSTDYNIDPNIVNTGLSLFNFFNNHYEYGIVSSIVASITGVSGYSLSHIPKSNNHTLAIKSPLFNNDSMNSTNLLFNSIYPIKIKNVSWKYLDPGDGWKPSGSHDYSSNEYENIDTTLNTYTDVPIELHIQTEYGTITDDAANLLLAPKFNIFGIKTYSLASSNYDQITKVWNLYVRCEPFVFHGNREIKITVEDYSDIDRRSINLNIAPRLKIVNIPNSSNPIYDDDLEPWTKLVNIYNGNNLQVITQYDHTLDCNSYLLNEHNISTNIVSENQVIQFPLLDNNFFTQNKDESFKVLVNGDGSELFFYTDCNDFSIPILIINDSDKINQETDTINIIAVGNDILISNISVANSKLLKKLVGKINFSVPKPGKYQIRIQISSNQLEIYDEFHDIFVSPKLNIDIESIQQSVVQDIKQAWSVYFYLDGVSGYLPGVSLSNLPMHGYYSPGNLPNSVVLNKYNTSLAYNSGLNQYIVNVTGVRNNDYDNNYARSGGIYNTEIYADDDHSFATGLLELNMVDSPYIINLQDKTDTYFKQSGTITLSSNTSNINVDNSLSEISQFNRQTIQKDNGLFDVRMTTSNPIDYIYDAKIDMDEFLNVGNFSVKVKGILGDKIACVAKLDTLDVSSSPIKIPLQIKRVSSQYSFQAAEAWAIEFDVCFGIADENYPPQVIMNGVPGGSCGLVKQCIQGSSLPIWCSTSEEAPYCFESRVFNNRSKCWTFKFRGNADCTNFLTAFDVLIIARDSIDDNNILAIDQKTTQFIFSDFSLPEAPNIQITQTSPGAIHPNCGTVSYSWSTKVNPRSLCPVNTGLSSFYLFGNLPSGLDLEFVSMTNLDGDFFEPPPESYYSLDRGKGTHDYGSGFYYIINLIERNIASISGNITGTVTEFFNGQKVVSGISTDFFDQSSNQSITISVSAGSLNDPLRYGVVFFDSDSPKFLLKNELTTNGIKGILNPPDPEVFENRSFFYESNGPYSGVYFTNDPLLGTITISGINRNIIGTLVSYDLRSNDTDYSNLYIKFLGNTNENEIILSKIKNHNLFNDTIDVYANINNVPVGSPEPCMFVIPDVVDNVFDQITAIPPLTRQDSNVLKCGSLFDEGNTTSIIGWVRPSYRASIRLNGENINQGDPINTYPYLASTANLSVEHFLSQSLSIEPIDGACCDYARNPIFFTNCYETGLIRLSGIVLPKPVVESTDYLKLIYADQQQNISIRISYGNNVAERNNQLNRRGPQNGGFTIPPSGNILRLNQFFNIIDTINVTNSTTTYGIENQSFILSSYPSGFVYGLNFVFGPSTTFPTLDINAIPRIENTQYGIYKAHTQSSQIVLEATDRHKFPLYIPIIDSGISYYSNSSITGVKGYIYGGFVGETSRYTIENSNISVDPFLYSSNPPVISGFLSSGLYKPYAANYSVDSDVINISGFFDVNTLNLKEGDSLSITFIDTEQGGFFDQELPTLITGVVINGVDTIGNSIQITVSSIGSNTDITNTKYESVTIQQVGRVEGLTPSSINFSLDDVSTVLTIDDLINIKPISGGIDSQLILGPTGYIRITGINNSDYLCKILPENILHTYYSTVDHIFVDKIIDAPISISLKNGNSTTASFDMDINIDSDAFEILSKEYNYHITTLDNDQYSPFIPSNSFWIPVNAGRTYPLYIVNELVVSITPEGGGVSDITPDSFLNGRHVGSFYIREGVRPLKDNIPYLERFDSCDFDYSIIYDDYLDVFIVNYAISDITGSRIRIFNNFGEFVEVCII